VKKIEPNFDVVAAAFDGDRRVTRGASKGFGSGALKVDGKIFAMICSKGKFVAKLPRARVDELVAGRKGERFNPTGKVMKEWFVAEDTGLDWLTLAREAYDFVNRTPPSKP
jgi:hypothetical protein